MEEQDKLMIAGFIYVLTKCSKLCRCDLDYAFEVFLSREEYEKCSVLKELIKMEYYDNDKNSNYESISAMINMINKFDDDSKDMFQFKIKLLQLKKELIDSIGELN